MSQVVLFCNRENTGCFEFLWHSRFWEGLFWPGSRKLENIVTSSTTAFASRNDKVKLGKAPDVGCRAYLRKGWPWLLLQVVCNIHLILSTHVMGLLVLILFYRISLQLALSNEIWRHITANKIVCNTICCGSEVLGLYSLLWFRRVAWVHLSLSVLRCYKIINNIAASPLVTIGCLGCKCTDRSVEHKPKALE